MGKLGPSSSQKAVRIEFHAGKCRFNLLHVNPVLTPEIAKQFKEVTNSPTESPRLARASLIGDMSSPKHWV